LSFYQKSQEIGREKANFCLNMIIHVKDLGCVITPNTFISTHCSLNLPNTTYCVLEFVNYNYQSQSQITKITSISCLLQ